MVLALGCDHAGFPLKQAIRRHLEERGIPYRDFGTESTDPVDYPVYAAKVAHAVVDGSCDLGILCCCTGIGISIAANKVDGARAALCGDAQTARLTRSHNDANVLCLAGGSLQPAQAIEIVDAFLSTPFNGETRHKRRVEMLAAIERGEL